MKVKVGIIGGGAIGLLFAYYFSEIGNEVTVYTRRENQAKKLNGYGLIMNRDEINHSVSVQAHTLKQAKKIEADLVVVAVKQYGLVNIIDTLNECVDKESQVLFVQNGMGHIELLNKLVHYHIFVGAVEHGVLKESDYLINHIGLGVTKIASYRGSNSLLKQPFEDGHCSFPFEFNEDWYQMLSGKLLINAVINPLTAVYRVKNGALTNNPHFKRNMKRLFDEAFTVLGLTDRESYWEGVLNVCHNTGGNRSSMLRDLELGHQTEIEAISGYLLQRAKTQKVQLPYTAFVYESIKGLSV